MALGVAGVILELPDGLAEPSAGGLGKFLASAGAMAHGSTVTGAWESGARHLPLNPILPQVGA